MSLMFAVVLVAAAAGSEPAAPVLPEPLATPSAVKIAHIVGWADRDAPQAPEGFKVQAYARGLDHPRNLLVLPNGDVIVAESRGTYASDGRQSANRVTLLRDSHSTGAADQRYALTKDIVRPFGLALRRDRLYVASSDAVHACPFLVGRVRLHGPCRQIAVLPDDGGRTHWTRNIVFSADERQLYVAVGSRTNVDEEHIDEKIPERAAILVSAPDGKGLRVYASGLRNPVGIALEPTTRALWTAVNERDLLGDDLVPDYLTSVREGAFYGWPYSYFGAHEDPRKRGERPDLVAQAVVPDYALEAHGAPLGLVFYTRTSFPAAYQGGAFVSLHGSWNRSVFSGYKVVHVPFKNGRPSGPPTDFLTGFIKDAQTNDVHGQPTGLAVMRDGSLLLADDSGGIIWRISYAPKEAARVAATGR
jgi:glucose/arabinose dehydrogenase